MPYIPQNQREVIDSSIDKLVDNILDQNLQTSKVCGSLNYVITRILMQTFLRKEGKISYGTVCMIDGIVSNIAREIYRRVAAPYEDQKIIENGDVKEFTNHE